MNQTVCLFILCFKLYPTFAVMVWGHLTVAAALVMASPADITIAVADVQGLCERFAI